jgi:murein DD-endopeptidase MepM/ murein hydrolase activator NlpD
VKPAPPDSKVAAQQLEAFFLRQLLAEARPQGGMIDGGFAGDTFKQMLDEAIADKMTAAGGIGMASMFQKQLGSAEETPAALPMPPQQLGPELGDAPRLVLPVAGRPSSGYGMRNDPIKHAAILHPGFDLAAPTGTAVGAAAGGTVVHAGPAGTYGNLVTVRHPNGYETRYAHLSAVTVHAGDHVEPGQQLGNVGTTGYSTGPHLHFEVRHEGQTIDPAPLLPLPALNRPGARTTR